MGCLVKNDSEVYCILIVCEYRVKNKLAVLERWGVWLFGGFEKKVVVLSRPER
jgi:hypothetical protein